MDSLDADSDVESATARKNPFPQWRLWNDFARPKAPKRSSAFARRVRQIHGARASGLPVRLRVFGSRRTRESSTRAPSAHLADAMAAIGSSARARRPGSVESSRFIGCVSFGDSEKAGLIREIHVEGWRRAWRRVSTSLEPWILPVPMRATPGMSRRPLSATHRDATRPTLLAVARKQTRATNLNLPRVFILRRTRLETRHPDSTARVESRAPHHGSPRNVTRD